MDAGLFLILLALLYVVKHIFDAILDFIKYNQPKHVKKSSDFLNIDGKF